MASSITVGRRVNSPGQVLFASLVAATAGFAIRRQATGEPFSRDEFVSRSLQIYQKFTPAEFAANAVVKTKGGE